MINNPLFNLKFRHLHPIKILANSPDFSNSRSFPYIPPDSKTIERSETNHAVILDELDNAFVEGRVTADFEVDRLEGGRQLVAFHVEGQRVRQGAVGFQQVDFT